MSWLGYSWTIAVNCFYLFIILAVFMTNWIIDPKRLL